jgi:hypothetical protein
MPELLGQINENSFGTPDVAKPVEVFVIDDLTDQRRTELAEPAEAVVDVLNGEHYAQVPEPYRYLRLYLSEHTDVAQNARGGYQLKVRMNAARALAMVARPEIEPSLVAKISVVADAKSFILQRTCFGA